MIRLSGIIRLALVLGVDFLAIASLFEDPLPAVIVTAVIALYACFGGYITLLRESAIRCAKLPEFDRARLDEAKTQLTEDVRQASSVSIARMKLFLIPGEADLQSTAYGANCVSVTEGVFRNADPVTLNAVLAHETSHILHLDSEFNRAVAASVTLVVAAIGVVSAAFVVLIFLLFLIFSLFRSILGVMAFRGLKKAVSGFFRLLQKGVILLYRSVLGLLSRHAEYRSDLYSAELGYGLQLAQFLSIAAPDTGGRPTLADALYRSHPPTPKRIARLEQHLQSSVEALR